MKFSTDKERLLLLQQYQIMDMAAEKDFDDLVQLAATICDVPLAAISILDGSRQWFKAKKGLEITETAIEYSFCRYTMCQNSLFIVENAQQDARFSDNPLVKKAPHIRFYAGVPLVCPGGEAIGSLCVMDSLERKLEETQKTALETLARQVVNLLELLANNHLLEASGREARQALLAKSEFLSVMSHELRTPLNGIIGLTHWFLEDKPRPAQLELMNTLKFSAEHLLSLINNILDYNKLQVQKLSLEKIDFNLSETLEHLRKSFAAIASGKDLTLEWTVQPHLPILKGDPQRLRQVLDNLIGNAIKFTHKGKVSMLAEPVMETENYLTIRFSILDTGIGIPADKLEIIFQEFVQVSPDTSRKYGGTGLGLPISKNLLQLMGSDLHVNSVEGKGTEFSFHVAFQKSGEQQQPIGQQAEKTRDQYALFSAHKKVLLVEDNRVSQLVCKKYLKKWGLEAHVANNGLEALKMVECYSYDLILMDLQMPEMDGFEATDKIRQMQAGKQPIPIIALTASATLQSRKQATAAGITDLLSKPFNPESLYHIICKHLPVKADMADKAEKLALLKQKVMNVTDGDEVFQKNLIHLFVKSFREILDLLNTGQLQHAEMLRRTRHKHKTSLRLLGLTAFEAALMDLQKALTSETADQAEIGAGIIKIRQLGEGHIEELEAIV